VLQDTVDMASKRMASL